MRMRFAIGVGLLAIAVALPAQDATFSTDVKVVNLLATVRDRDGKFVKDLTKEDFTVEEEGRPQTIRYFTQESNLPLSIGLMVDTSCSQIHVLEAERTASYTFLDQVLRGEDVAFVLHFDYKVSLLQGLPHPARIWPRPSASLRGPSTATLCCSMRFMMRPSS